MSVTIYKYPNDFRVLIAKQEKSEYLQAAQDVKCSDCFYFQHDCIGDGGGIGNCAIYCESKVKHSLYPNIIHHCEEFIPHKNQGTLV